MSELDSVNIFIDEGLKHWKQNPQFVAGESFFRIWQESCRPLPFRLPLKGLKLAGKSVFPAPEITADSPAPIVRIQWSAEHGCPMLICEAGYDAVTRLVRFNDDGVSFERGEKISNPLDNNILGEHVEAMFEVAKLLKDRHPQMNLSKVGDKMVLSALEELGDRSDNPAYRKVHSFLVRDRVRLMQKVIADMAEDEFSSQLTLGLVMDEQAAPPEPDYADELPPCTLPARGNWEVSQDVDLLCEAELERLKSETSFVFNFKDAVPMSPLQETRQAIRIPCTDEMLAYLHDGARFVLFPDDDPRNIQGIFQMELYEDKAIIGYIEWNSAQNTLPLGEHLCAMPRKSPQEYITRSLEVFQKTLFDASASELSALRGLLGITPLSFTFPPPARSADFPKLDFWQVCAVRSCLDASNPVVLVQGPPGTGKTSVLEVVIRELAKVHARILVTAPSNTAVDNICKRIQDLPLLRHANQKDAVAADIAAACWAGDENCLADFTAKAAELQCEVHAGTHIGILRSPIVAESLDGGRAFDVIIFDEAGMSRTAEALLCLCLARRAFIFGDAQQLPPFPLQESIWEKLRSRHDVMSKSQEDFIGNGLLAWLQIHRRCPAILLRTCYRCHNPRLMRFASLLFYNALVKSDTDSDYFRLPYRQRQQLYPRTSLEFLSTSGLDESLRRDQLRFDGFQPGYENLTEAKICVKLILDSVGKYPLDEITVISPYKKQVRLIRRLLGKCPHGVPDAQWQTFCHERIATVDSFQGGESDTVIISYVRSGGSGVGFVDDPNRVNVTHTRCRKEMHVVGDLDFLREHAENNIFQRMERSFIRDGVIDTLSPADFADIESGLPESCRQEIAAVEEQDRLLAPVPAETPLPEA